MVYRGVRGLRKGSEKRLGCYGRCSKNRGLRFRGRLRVGGSVQVCIHVYKLPVNRTKT